jgi:hypothetical protein
MVPTERQGHHQLVAVRTGLGRELGDVVLNAVRIVKEVTRSASPFGTLSPVAPADALHLGE